MPPMRPRPHEKTIFCRPSSGYKNCGTRSVNIVWFFSESGWYHGFLWWDRQFVTQIFRLRSIERHAAAEPTQCPHMLAAWHYFCCAALPRYAASTRHSVDVPLDCSCSGTPFRDVFSISVALSLSAVLQLSSIIPGGSEGRVVGRNTRGNEITKKFKNLIIGSIITSKEFLSIKICK